MTLLPESLSETKSNLPLLRLNNLYAKSTTFASSPKLAATVTHEDHDFILRGVLAGEHGAMQAILSHFWFKFTEHVRAKGFKPYWNPDNKNPERIAKILSYLNFVDLSVLIPKLQEQEATIARLQYELSLLQSQRPGRTNPSPTKPKKQSPTSNSLKRRTRSDRSKVPPIRGTTKSPEGNGNDRGEASESQET